MTSTEPAATRPTATDAPDDMAALYPFLYSDTETDLRAVMNQVRESTIAKAAEIIALRRDIAAHGAEPLIACALAMAERFAAGARLFVFGNGGSATDAQQVATSFLNPREGGALPAISLSSDIAAITALSNDIGFEVVFARQLAAFGRRADIAFALSTSGGSVNLLRALTEAGRIGMLTVGMAAAPGGKMAELGPVIDHLLLVPSASVHRVQEAQATIYHNLGTLVRSALSHKEDLP